MILEEETFDKFGYYPSDLKPKSHKRILVACDDCGKIREICKDGYHDFCKPCAQKGEKNPFFGKHHTEEAKKKISEAALIRLQRLGEKERMQKIGHHQGGKKTKPEEIFIEICKRNNLDFHYVGDGSLWIGKKGEKQLNPDFIEANGKKICIEIMGAYWHSRLLNRNLREDALLPFREKHYKKYKWIPVFIWDTDLLREDAEQFVLNQLEKGDAI